MKKKNPKPRPINKVTIIVAKWYPKFADKVFLKPNLAPLAAKNIFPGPGLKARGKRKINRAAISISFIILISKYF